MKYLNTGTYKFFERNLPANFFINCFVRFRVFFCETANELPTHAITAFRQNQSLMKSYGKIPEKL